RLPDGRPGGAAVRIAGFDEAAGRGAAEDLSRKRDPRLEAGRPEVSRRAGFSGRVRAAKIRDGTFQATETIYMNDRNRISDMPVFPKSKRGEPTWEVAQFFPTQGEWTEADYL